MNDERMSEEEIRGLIEYLASMILALHCEIRSLREAILETCDVTPEELQEKLKRISAEESQSLRTEGQRRAFERALTERKVQ